MKALKLDPLLERWLASWVVDPRFSGCISWTTVKAEGRKKRHVLIPLLWKSRLEHTPSYSTNEKMNATFELPANDLIKEMPTFSFGKRYISPTRLPKLAQIQLLHTHHSILPDHCVVTPIFKVDLLEVDFTHFCRTEKRISGAVLLGSLPGCRCYAYLWWTWRSSWCCLVARCFELQTNLPTDLT